MFEKALPGLGLSQLCHQQEVRLEASFWVGLGERGFNGMVGAAPQFRILARAKGDLPTKAPAPPDAQRFINGHCHRFSLSLICEMTGPASDVAKGLCTSEVRPSVLSLLKAVSTE